MGFLSEQPMSLTAQSGVASPGADLVVATEGSSRLQRHVLIHPPDWGEGQLLQLHSTARRRKYWTVGPWIEYFPGTGGLVVAAPHDGMCKPPQIPVRTFGITVRDTGTKGLAANLALELLRRHRARPHLLVCHLSRRCLDMNRAREQAASHPGALRVWDAYHELLSRACAAAAKSFGGALLVDVHAQAHWKHTGIDAIEVGTLFPSSAELQLGDADLGELLAAALSEGCVGSKPGRLPGEVEDSGVRRNRFTMPRLAAATSSNGRKSSLADLIRGPHSLGSLLSAQGFIATPSQAFPAPPRKPADSGKLDSEAFSVDLSNTQLPRALSDDDSDKTRASADEEDEDKVGAEGNFFFFNGSSSYVLAQYTGVLDCVQMEFPSRLTRNGAGWRCMACSVLDSLAQFWRMHTRRELFVAADAGERLAVMAAEPGSKARAYRLAQELGFLASKAMRLPRSINMPALSEAGRIYSITSWLMAQDRSGPDWYSMDCPLEHLAERCSFSRGCLVCPHFGLRSICDVEVEWRTLDFLDTAMARFEPHFRLRVCDDVVAEKVVVESADGLMSRALRSVEEKDQMHLLLNLVDDPLNGVLHWSESMPSSAFFPGCKMPAPSGKMKHTTDQRQAMALLWSPLPHGEGCKLRLLLLDKRVVPFTWEEEKLWNAKDNGQKWKFMWKEILESVSRSCESVKVESRRYAARCPRAAFYKLCRERGPQQEPAKAPDAAAA